jgi:MFS family permease
MGAAFGGMVSGHLLGLGGWQNLFLFGGLWTAAMLPLVWLLLPESIDWPIDKQQKNALAKIASGLRLSTDIQEAGGHERRHPLFYRDKILGFAQAPRQFVDAPGACQG